MSGFGIVYTLDMGPTQLCLPKFTVNSHQLIK